MRLLWLVGFTASVLLVMADRASAGTVTVYPNEASFLAAMTGATLLGFNSFPVQQPGQLEIAPPAFFSSTNNLNIGERPFVCGDGWGDTLDVTIVGNYQAFDGPRGCGRFDVCHIASWQGLQRLFDLSGRTGT